MLIAVHLVILLHISHFWITGRSVSPVEPSESMYTIELGQVNAGAIFFGLAIVSTVIFGRFFCGWGCHIVALQDLSSYLLRRIGIRPKPLRSRLLAFVPFALAFYMFFWPTLKRLWRGDPIPQFTNHLMTENFWYTFPGVAVSIATFLVCGGLIVYLLGNKGFCTYACPYGALFSVSDRLAIGRIRVTDDCHQCGQCTAHCTSNVQVHAEVRDFGMVLDPGCMKCMDCVSVCPKEALYFGLSPRSSSAGTISSAAVSDRSSAFKRNYDFSLAEEVSGLAVAAFFIFSLRGLYNVFPLLLTVAIAVISAYLAIQLGRVFRLRDVRIQGFRLKNNRRITKTGWWTIGMLTIWFAFAAHSFAVQYTRYQGQRLLNRVAVSWNELVSGKAQQEFSSLDRENIDRSLKNLRISDELGMLDVLQVKMGLAIGSLMKGELDSAEQYLRQAYACDPATVGEMLREFLVSRDRQDEAAAIE